MSKQSGRGNGPVREVPIQFGNQGPTADILQGPIGIAIDSNGNVFVADGIDSDIHVFSQVKL